MKFLKKNGVKILCVILLVLVLLTKTAPGISLIKTSTIIYNIFSDPLGNKINSTKSSSIVKEVSFKSNERTIYADLWIPKEKNKYPATILSLGIDIDKGDHRITRLAKILSESGFVVLIPNIPSITSRRLNIDAKEDLVSSFEFLNSQSGIKKNKIGFISFCASAGLAVLAAEDEKINNKVAYVVTVNPYFNLETLYKNIVFHQMQFEDKTLPWNPYFKTVEIYNRETVALLNNSDQKILDKYLVKISNSDLESGNYKPLSDIDTTLLSRDGLFTYALLANKDRKRISSLIENKTEAQKNFILNLSPSTKIGNLKTKLFILSDKNNIFIPYSHAQELASSMPENQRVFTETTLIPAGNLKANLPMWENIYEGAKLAVFVYQIFIKAF